MALVKTKVKLDCTRRPSEEGLGIKERGRLAETKYDMDMIGVSLGMLGMSYEWKRYHSERVGKYYICGCFHV
jgi:hypothetical protein